MTPGLQWYTDPVTKVRSRRCVTPHGSVGCHGSRVLSGNRCAFCGHPADKPAPEGTTDVPPEAQAKSSGALRALHPVSR